MSRATRAQTLAAASPDVPAPAGEAIDPIGGARIQLGTVDWLDYHFRNGSNSGGSELDARLEGPYRALSFTF